MADFNEAWRLTSVWEGGYVNNLNDPGGETNFGISKKSYPNLNIKALRVEDAKQIYRKDFWNRCKLNQVDSQRIANKIFDIAVNSGTSKAGKMLQEACNILGKSLVVDGVIGEKTMQATNSFKYDEAVEKVLIYLRVKYYLELAENPKRRSFLFGWLRRA